MGKTIFTAIAVGAALVVGAAFTPAGAESSCDGPLAASQTDDGGEACFETGRDVSGTVLVGDSYVAVDGSTTNPEPADGYVGVDEQGPSACASGDYEPGGDNNLLLPGIDDEAPSPDEPPSAGGPCSPQAPKS